MTEPSQRNIDGARDAAYRFLVDRGDPFQQLRARCLLGERPPSAVTKQLLERGALRAEGPAALLPALEALDQLDQLDAPELEPVVAALAGVLGEDGAWGVAGEALEARIVLTADLAGYLTKTLRLRPRVRDAVDGFLCRTWSPDRVRAGAWAPIAAYAHFFSVNESELSDAALQWCGRELERGFRTRRFDAPATARVFLRCRAVALPGASLTAAELCRALVAEQTEEGGFALSGRALAGEPGEAALDALAGLVHLGPAAAAGPAEGDS